jgi:hypothetical protein
MKAGSLFESTGGHVCLRISLSSSNLEYWIIYGLYKHITTTKFKISTRTNRTIKEKWQEITMLSEF